MTTAHPSGDTSEELQASLDRISQRLGVPSMPVGLRSNDGLTIYVDDRKQGSLYQYEVMSKFSPKWPKRQVRELPEMFRNGQPEDIAFYLTSANPYSWLLRRASRSERSAR